MRFRAIGQTLIVSRQIPKKPVFFNYRPELCWWSSTCLWCVAFPPDCRGYTHRTNAVWLTPGAFARRKIRIQRLQSKFFYLSMASYLPDFCADGSTYAGFSGNTT
jgi:hypothetical protein